MLRAAVGFVLVAVSPSSVQAWVAAPLTGRTPSALSATTTWFATETTTTPSLEKQKATLLQLGAALDRGQSYNPTSGDYVSFRSLETL